MADSTRSYGPFISAEREQANVRRYPNGVVRTVTVTDDGRRLVVWDFSEDTHRS